MPANRLGSASLCIYQFKNVIQLTSNYTSLANRAVAGIFRLRWPVHEDLPQDDGDDEHQQEPDTCGAERRHSWKVRLDEAVDTADDDSI